MAKTGFDCPKCGAGILECSQGKCIRCGYMLGGGEAISLAITSALKPVQEESTKKFDAAANEILASVDQISQAGKKFCEDVIKIHEESSAKLQKNIADSLMKMRTQPTMLDIIKAKFSALFG